MSAYIVPSTLLKTDPPKAEWHATEIPTDPTLSLVVVLWDNPNAEAEFELLPGVSPLGEPWEPIPAEAATLLAPLQDRVETIPESTGTVIPSTDGTPAPAETVTSALRKLSWPGARMVR